jgi:hypothetical protein
MFYKHLRTFFTGIQNHTQIKHCGRYLKGRHALVSSFRRKNPCHLKPENDNSWLWEDDSGRKTTSQEEDIIRTHLKNSVLYFIESLNNTVSMVSGVGCQVSANQMAEGRKQSVFFPLLSVFFALASVSS